MGSAGACSLPAAAAAVASRQEAKGGSCPCCKRTEGVAETTRAALRDSPLKGVILYGMDFTPLGHLATSRTVCINIMAK